MAAKDVRTGACLVDWRPAKNIDTDRANSYTSPPFKNPSQPDVSWKLIVKGATGSAYTCSAGKEAGTCKECLEFSLEREDGGEPESFEGELVVIVGGQHSPRLGTPSGMTISSSGVFRAFPAHLRVPTVNRLIRDVTISTSVHDRAKAVPCTFSNEAILASPKFPDFEVRVGAERIPIHREIFARFSEVFLRMLERDMEEKAQGFVVIEDSSPSAFRTLRTFLYSGRAEGVREEPWALLDLAEKYAVRELRDVCVVELKRQLSGHTLCEWAVAADKYGLDGLFGDCCDLLKRPDGSFSVSKEHWDGLVKDHQDVAIRLLTHNVTFA